MSKRQARDLQIAVPIVRLTLIGAGGAGKTFLIDSFLNSPPEVEDPTGATAPTQTVEIYHKLVKLPRDELSVLSHTEWAIVEIEDTPPSSLGETIEDYMRYAYDHELKQVKVEDYVIASSAARFFRMDRENPYEVSEDEKKPTALMPFSLFSYPRETKGKSRVKPLTQGRMGIFLVFSLIDSQSLEEAINAHWVITAMRESNPTALQPICFLIGNKDDLVGNSEDRDDRPLLAKAEEYCTRSDLPFFRVSALTGKSVERAFVEIITQIVQTPSLSAFDIYRATEDDEDISAEDGDQY